MGLQRDNGGTNDAHLMKVEIHCAIRSCGKEMAAKLMKFVFVLTIE
jgi:hypothetical protein